MQNDPPPPCYADALTQEDRVMGFAVWIGRMGAALAAVLAVVWLIEASPEREPSRPDMATASVAYCRGQAWLELTRMEIDRTRTAREIAEARARVEACGPQPPPRRTTWDSAGVMQALAAGAVAIALLLMSSVAARQAEPAPALPRPSFQELADLIEEERAMRLRLTGKPITEAEARETVERRLIYQGRTGRHG
jgi:hypothetical protein